MNGMRMNPLGLTGGISTLLLLSSAPAQAQSTAPADAGASQQGLEEIVVTAQRRSENLQSVPIAVSAVSAERLASAGITNTQALQAVIPGLVINQVGGASGIYLRGVGTRVAFAGLEPSTATYQDDRYISGQTGTLFELMDVQRVEVLKGPQGVLYGRNATSGAVRVITNDVDSILSGHLQGSYGNYDDRELRGTLNVPLTSDLGIRIAGLYHKRDGFVDNLDPRGRSQLNDKNVYAIRGKAKWEATPDLTVRLIVDHWRQRDTSGLATVVLGPQNLSPAIAAGGQTGQSSGEAYTQIKDPMNQRSTAGELRIDADLGLGNFASITTYDRNNATYTIDYDGTSAIALDVVRTDSKQRTFSQEFQLASKTDGPLEWLVGGNYFHNRAYTLAQIATPLLISTGGRQTAYTRAFAVYGQATYHLTDSVAAILGGRYTWERKRVLVETDPNSVTLVPAALLPYRDQVSVERFNPKVVLQWKYGPNQMLYASFTQGFKSGGFNYPPTPPAPVLKPEILNSFELGWKAELFDRHLRLNINGFYYDYKDLQVSRSVLLPGSATFVTQTDNAATARVKGVEAEFTARLASELTLSGGASYIDGKYRKYPAAIAPVYRVDAGSTALGLVSLPFNATGHRMLRLPRFSGNLTATYNPAIGDGHLPISVTYSYKSSYLFDFIATPRTSVFRQPGFGLLSANVGYTAPGDRYKVSLYGTNLANKHYLNLRQSTGNAIIGTYGDPRTYGVRLEFNF